MLKTEEKRTPYASYGGGGWGIRNKSVTVASLANDVLALFNKRPVWSEPMTMDEYLALDSHDPNMVYVIVGS